MKKFLISAYISFSALTLIPPIAAGLLLPRKPPESAAAFAAHSAVGTSERRISVLDSKRGKVSDVNLEEYLIGVLAGEMPAEYELEALKAQAVAARTYIMHKSAAPAPEHPDAVVCSNPEHCKAWLSDDDCTEKWGALSADTYRAKLSRAVFETKGEYMIYEGEPIEAVFFASCGGRTENSSDVWGGARDYLKSVSSPETADAVKSEVKISFDEFCKILKSLNPDINLGAGAPAFGEILRTEGGSVNSWEVGGKHFGGTELRAAFGLKSANFTPSRTEDEIVFSVTGSGHGVGMSQLGANLMAKNGKKYTEILTHYYSNIQIVKK